MLLQDPLGTDCGVLSRGRAHSSAEVTEMNGWPRLAPGAAAGLLKMVSHWGMQG